MALRIHPAWLPVVGERVQMRRNGAVMGEGVIDAVTADDSILWITGYGLETRKMFERADGFEVWLNYRWESLEPPPAKESK